MSHIFSVNSGYYSCATCLELLLGLGIMGTSLLIILPCCFAFTVHWPDTPIKALRCHIRCIELFTQGQLIMTKEGLHSPVSCCFEIITFTFLSFKDKLISPSQTKIFFSRSKLFMAFIYCGLSRVIYM